jgi:hypothetical protein
MLAALLLVIITPKFCDFIITLNMNVSRLISITWVKENLLISLGSQRTLW